MWNTTPPVRPLVGGITWELFKNYRILFVTPWCLFWSPFTTSSSIWGWIFYTPPSQGCQELYLDDQKGAQRLHMRDRLLNTCSLAARSVRARSLLGTTLPAPPATAPPAPRPHQILATALNNKLLDSVLFRILSRAITSLSVQVRQYTPHVCDQNYLYILICIQNIKAKQ
jgi:hypothetical protein